MKKSFVGYLAAAAVFLASCSTPDGAPPQPLGDDRVGGKTWQAIGVYTSPETNGAISENTLSFPRVVFGETSMLGSTGCEQFSAKVTYFSDASDSENPDPTELRKADAVRIDSIVFDTEGETGSMECTGEMLWTHNNLSRLYAQGNEFDITVDKNNQLILTLQDGRVDSPAIRYIGL
ncbi:hypothetical protein [Corynebacterium sp. J010B-136]|uniref:hypothetical protein n=1 Tax=Corynebacterium sp. J010B-136 TaxID=2099401 RepID=UPI000CF9C0D2|nr:hypothetical protein [Corynebacterium sp. J010B-136]PQM74335.1 hypothetical protein C5Y44_08520 [Corynebacterium sp. J010B-136]